MAYLISSIYNQRFQSTNQSYRYPISNRSSNMAYTVYRQHLFDTDYSRLYSINKKRLSVEMLPLHHGIN